MLNLVFLNSLHRVTLKRNRAIFHGVGFYTLHVRAMGSFQAQSDPSSTSMSDSPNSVPQFPLSMTLPQYNQNNI